MKRSMAYRSFADVGITAAVAADALRTCDVVMGAFA
jgi:hypothetical protein